MKEWNEYKEREIEDFHPIPKGDKYGLMVNVWVDSSKEYKWNNHPKWLYFQNDKNDIIPMVITKNHIFHLIIIERLVIKR